MALLVELHFLVFSKGEGVGWGGELLNLYSFQDKMPRKILHAAPPIVLVARLIPPAPLSKKRLIAPTPLS